MAKAVEVVRENAIVRLRLEDEAKAATAAQLQRAAQVEQVSTSFENACRQMLDTLAAASTELDATAQAGDGGRCRADVFDDGQCGLRHAGEFHQCRCCG